MKKLKFYSLILSAIFLFFSCKKDDSDSCIRIINSSILNSHQFQDMLLQLDNESFYKNSNNILVFANRETLLSVLNILETSCDEILDNDTTLTYDDFFSAFEQHYNFFSLRHKIEGEIKVLEQSDNLFEHNDPDNHFIVNDFLRSLLTPDCEIIVGDLWFILRDGFSIGIMNGDRRTRNSIIELIHSGCRNTDLYYFCNENKNAFIVSEGSPILNPEFSFNPVSDNENPYSYNFINMTSHEKYSNTSYQWYFGDGNYSSQENPIHNFTSPGTYDITLKAFNGEDIKQITKTIKVGGMTADFKVTHNFNGNYYFTAELIGSTSPSYQYYWDFGDGESTTSTNKSTNHRFRFNNTSYNVSLTITNTHGETIYCQRTINVSYKENCKTNTSAHSGTTSFPHYHLSNGNYVKTYISAYNGFILHDLTSKAIYLRKKNNGSYVRTNANSIETSINGYIYLTHTDDVSDAECGVPQLINLYKTKNNQAYVIKSHSSCGDRFKFSVDQHSIGTSFTIDNTYNHTGVSIHN